MAPTEVIRPRRSPNGSASSKACRSKAQGPGLAKLEHNISVATAISQAS
jgi:hypothetical protein